MNDKRCGVAEYETGSSESGSCSPGVECGRRRNREGAMIYQQRRQTVIWRKELPAPAPTLIQGCTTKVMLGSPPSKRKEEMSQVNRGATVCVSPSLTSEDRPVDGVY